MTMPGWALVELVLLLLILLFVYHSKPACPGCKGKHARQDPLLPWVYRCQNPYCREVYEVRNR